MIDVLDTADSIRFMGRGSNMTNLTVARSFLEQMKVEVDTVSSGKGSLEYIGRNKYDIIFLDHMMPELSGVKVLREIKQKPDKYQININTPFNRKTILMLPFKYQYGIIIQ